MKKFFLSIMILSHLTNNFIIAGNGGSVAAGVLGGLGAGAIIGAAASSCNRPRDVVYIKENPPIYKRRRISEIELSRWEQKLIDLEQDLIAKEDYLLEKEEMLARKSRKLAKKERELNKRFDKVRNLEKIKINKEK